jgi:hypothetical protein
LPSGGGILYKKSDRGLKRRETCAVSLATSLWKFSVIGPGPRIVRTVSERRFVREKPRGQLCVDGGRRKKYLLE